MLMQPVALLNVCHPEPGRGGNIGAQDHNSGCLVLPSNQVYPGFDGRFPLA